MTAPKDGGGAFPQFSLNPTPDGSTVLAATGGMTLRDWFAGQALLASYHAYDAGRYDGGNEEIAGCAYQMADAMLAAREAKS